MMMAVACTIPSWGFTMNFLFLISGVRYYATPANEWTELIHPHIPSWLPKIVILKYGGPKVYKSSLPFFLGMIVGAFVSAGIWNIISFFTGMTNIHLTVM